MSGVLIAHGVALAITAVAAVTDWRSGRIPNWLTLPVIAIAPLVHGLLSGVEGFLLSAGGIVACGLVPLLVARLGGMAGGDVKLFAALGAVLGVFVGIEAQFFAIVVAAIFALGRLTWQGKLFGTLANSLFLGLNPILPKKWRREIASELLHEIRLGAAIFVGTLIAILLRNPLLWSLT